MKFVKFQVRLFRSIIDVQTVNVGDVTALVGKNETGKTNLLEALEFISQSEERVPSPSQDIPVGHSLEELPLNDPWFVQAHWDLDDIDREKFSKIYLPAKKASSLIVNRRYDQRSSYFGLYGSVWARIPQQKATAIFNKIVEIFKIIPEFSPYFNELKNLEKILSQSEISIPEWSSNVKNQVDILKKSISGRVSEEIESMLNNLDALAVNTAKQKEEGDKLINYISKNLPRILYFDEYPDPVGRQKIFELHKRIQDKKMDESDIGFRRMMKLGGIDENSFLNLGKMPKDARQRLLKDAGIKITKMLAKFWPQRGLTFRFDYDNGEIDTIVIEKRDGHLMEINLDDRSKGFRWFFSLFCAYASGGDNDDTPAILLLDEPGMHLHASAQRDLLKFFYDHMESQVVYTTHSPFLVDPAKLSDVRTVHFSEEKGTTVSQEIEGDKDTLFPLQAALGISVAQNLFSSDNALLVEGITDLWIIESVSSMLNALDGSGLRKDLVIIPSGGSSRIAIFSAFLGAQDMKCVALLDKEPDAMREASEIIKKKLMREESLIFTAIAFGSKQVKEADIEDIIDVDFVLVRLLAKILPKGVRCSGIA